MKIDLDGDPVEDGSLFYTCDMCGDQNDTVGLSGCDHPEHALWLICKHCDIDGQNYNGWCL